MHLRLTRSLLVGSALTLALTACGQPPSSVAADPYAGGVSYPWAYTTSPNQLTPLSLTAGENNLYYEPILAAHNAWGPIEIDRSNGEQQAGDGKTLTLNGVTFDRGFGTHAGSEMRFGLKGTDATCTRFTSQIGLDDEVGSKGSVVFQVYLDGQKAYDSGTMTGASPTKTIDLDITGKQELRLVVTDAGDGIDFDHADWAKPLISCQATTPSRPATLTLNQSALSVYHLNTGTLQATFANYKSGPVDIRLVADPIQPGFNPVPIVLQTNTLTLSGAASETHDLVFAAPKPLGAFSYSSAFHLVISQNGQPLDRVPVQLTELPINFTASFEPRSVTGRPEEVKTVILTVTADPPLDRAYPLALISPVYPGDGSRILSVGPVSGDGARMQAEVTFRFGGFSGSISGGVNIGNSTTGVITAGYRDQFYRSNPEFVLFYTVIR
ncbi:NPCBM/NEW2 domain-containing protein [Deinococcus sp. QL22]|uniref:NPCBM/NEW2 domain-containing protein n=1 Tax=Deinococcus sp. QL22 TaxID=2939437 RepID=UPI00201759F6|nr:NPCBM/NEW2 domain-containing protein [Deinococcus sp. QL22]UQN06258.1 NPCBM/NEW2 domain-containing protein [Deinococcus sp. QL22]